MFERRFSKFGKAFLLTACLLFVGGLQQSCKDWLDDYKYYDSEPEWLGESIYAFLQEGTANHTYRNYVELIDSLGEKETLEKTGSKTLFVADDKAFERFYANNPWGVKSVKDMTVAQRKYIFYNTMLSNAILLDMMPNTSESSEGDCISRATEFNSLDSVSRVHPNYYPLHSSWPTYNQYWSLFAKQDTLLMSMSSASIVHFFDEYLKKNAISVSDVNFLFQKGGATSKSYAKGDVFLFGNKLVDSEVDAGTFSEDSLTVSCKNGYVYRMDEVLVPPMDMASELRAREDARIFSHLLDRFCVPVFDGDLTNDYRIYHNVLTDSVFALRYFTTANTTAGVSFTGTGVKAPAADEVLSYDPGARKGASDLYAMLVPKDEALYEYFADPDSGAGNFLIKNYAPDVEVERRYSEAAVDRLLTALDSVPQVNIATFLNNLLQESFAATVPSKFDRITDDANDDMKIKEQHVDECLIANNGVVYLLNKVFSPAAFSSVSGPVDIYDNMRLVKNFIKDLKYNYYLLAMDADYSFIVPDDGSFIYYDPISYDKYEAAEGMMKMHVYHYDNKRKANKTSNEELWRAEYQIDKKTLEIDTLLSETTGYNSKIATDLLEYLIIVHDKVEPRVHADRLYYSTKGYGTIKVDASDPDKVKFYGGEQLENGTEIVSSMIINQQNGITYCTVPAKEPTDSLLLYSSVPAPPKNSIYNNMSSYGTKDGELYYEFFNLCNSPEGSALKNVLKKAYSDDPKLEDTVKLYSIFYTGGSMKNCVPFLNTYHYTVYIPSNESIKELYEQGLPTWEMITAESDKNPMKAASMVRLLNSFARYHFQDNSVYYDRSPFFVPDVNGGKLYEASMATSLINNITDRFYEMVVKSDETHSTLLIEDEWAKENKAQLARIVNTPAENENKTWNVMCRDRQGTSSIETSSYAVLQPIDRALLNSSLFGYDGRFKRYAVTGECVDTMYVAGGQNGALGGNCYLVAKAGRVPRSTKDQAQPEALENVEMAYLMQPIDETHESWNSSIAREVLVCDENELPILITRDGYRITRTEDTRNKTVAYNFYTVTEDGKKYMIKVDNAGVEIARELYNENKVENGSTGETSEE